MVYYIVFFAKGQVVQIDSFDNPDAWDIAWQNARYNLAHGPVGWDSFQVHTEVK